MITRQTFLLLQDELVGFAKSKVMVVLWIALPALAILGYFFLPLQGTDDIPLTILMGVVVSSVAGTIAAAMVCVDILSERSRGVYELFLIRPLRPESIVWAKFLATFSCVTIACIIAVSVGLVVDLIRGVEVTVDLVRQTFTSLGLATGVIAVSVAIGVFTGVLLKSIIVAVILIIYVGPNLAALPVLPAILGWSGDYYWLMLGVSAIVTLVIMYFAGVLFRRAEF